MKLIPEWRQAPRMMSVQAMTLALALQGAWQALPDDLRASLPTELVPWLSMALLALGVIGRLIQQPAIQAEAGQ